ncbi:MAG: hypothetical protein ABR588_03380 [Sphingomicrobium sp.]|nr:hypothetical protein [Sphingomonadales bacterium]
MLTVDSCRRSNARDSYGLPSNGAQYEKGERRGNAETRLAVNEAAPCRNFATAPSCRTRRTTPTITTAGGGTMMRIGTTIVTIAALLVPTAASARKSPDSGTPQSISRLLACRQLTDAAARLGCFDGESARVATGIASKDLVVVDRERARVAGRSMFGFSIPNFGGLFGSEGEIKSIEGTITSVAHNPYGGWLLRLDDNSLWSQTDDSILGLSPRVGNKVTVRRGALGSFQLSVNGQPGLKVTRVG